MGKFSGSGSGWCTLPETEGEMFIFSWLSTWKADWNGLAIVYKFFWSDPSLWTYLSWPWSDRPLCHWTAAAVYTLCHAHIVKAIESLLSMLFSTQDAYLHLFVKNVLWLSISVSSVVVSSLSFSTRACLSFHSLRIHCRVSCNSGTVVSLSKC